MTTILLYGCAAPGGSPRKKMPEFTGGGGEFEAFTPFKNQNAEMGFLSRNTNMLYQGIPIECVSFTLPASLDEQVLSLFSQYKPFAGPLLAAWAKQQRNGVVIDLKSSSGLGASQADFQVKNADNSIIPIVFLWNSQSALRASKYMNMLGEIPGVTVKLVNKKEGLQQENHEK